MSDFETTLRKLRVPIYTEGTQEFELSVATGNFLYRFNRPEWVVRPRNGEDVATTVKLANKYITDARITVKNGGHSYAGFSNAEGGVLIDLCNMKAVFIEDVDEGTKHMTLSAGTLWGDAYKEMARDKKYRGWMVNGGRCPLVGVSGFLLGGGFGPFSRSVGMGMDQVVEVDVVTAKGDIITVGEADPSDSEKGELFWALRGCGGGNFGIVTRWKIRVVKLADEWVVAGRLIWKVTDVLAFKAMMVDFYTADWDNCTTIDSTWECDLPSSTDARPFSTRFMPYYDGKKKAFNTEIDAKLPNQVPKSDATEEDKDLLQRCNTERKNFREQLKRRALREPSTLFLHETLGAQWSEEMRRSLPTDRAYTLYSSFIIENDAGKITAITDIICDQIQRFRTKFTGERGTFGVTWIHVGGDIANEDKERTSTSTPYPWRKGNYCVYILVRWHEKWLLKEMGEFFDKCKAQLKLHSMEQKASYVNFPDRRLGNWSEAYYGGNWTKLRRIHEAWDGEEKPVLRFLQNIGKAEPEEGDESDESDENVENDGNEENEESEDGGESGADDKAPSANMCSTGGGSSLTIASNSAPRAPVILVDLPRVAPQKARERGSKKSTKASASRAKHNWESQWKKYNPPAKGYEYYVSQGDYLPRC